MINCDFSVGLWGNVFCGIAGVMLLTLSGFGSSLSSLSLERIHNRQMTKSKTMTPANEPAPMAIPITTRESNIVASNFFLVILAADVMVIVVVLTRVDVVLPVVVLGVDLPSEQ